ncbi:MAG: tRNA pseudouridine(13) synthase TruD [Planctomycetota bacterium]|nr:tRNA pseudouridine(13) synthase TruD [Planctomycetota bacterium]
MLPFITDGLPGIGGALKVEPSHFIVEEIPLYEPEGEGEHIYVTLRREGQTTRQVQMELCRLFELHDQAVGCAGLKDKHARTTQTFSLHMPGDEQQVAERIQAEMDVEMFSAKRHLNKLKTGHLIGNRFTILVVNVEDAALGLAERIAAKLNKFGLPNFYGEQRFGRDGENAKTGKEILKGKRLRKHWLRKLMLSAYQSQMFNEWLVARMERGWFGEILAGDVARKEETGGMFDVEDAQTDQARFMDREISYTGPIFGKKMRKASGLPGDLEEAILAGEEVTLEQFRKAKVDGTRRRACLFLADLSLSQQSGGLSFSFSLPKGSYATTVMREFMKTELELPESD